MDELDTWHAQSSGGNSTKLTPVEKVRHKKKMPIQMKKQLNIPDWGHRAYVPNTAENRLIWGGSLIPETSNAYIYVGHDDSDSDNGSEEESTSYHNDNEE